MPEIISTLLQAGDTLSLYQRRRKDLPLERNAADRLHLEQEALRQADEDLWLSLVRFADRMDAADRIERLILTLEDNVEDRTIVVGSRSIFEWLVWGLGSSFGVLRKCQGFSSSLQRNHRMFLEHEEKFKNTDILRV